MILEVVPGERFTFTDAFDSEWNPQHAFMVGTRYTAGARHWNQEDLEKHKEMGFTTRAAGSM